MYTTKEELELVLLLKGKRKAGILNHWTIVDDYRRGGKIVNGIITGDSRWDDGSNVYTSGMLTLHEEFAILETENSYYGLGEPFSNQAKLDVFRDSVRADDGYEY